MRRTLAYRVAMRSHRTTWALASYAAIVLAFRLGLERSSVSRGLGENFRYAFASFSLLLAPLWFFGFGLGEWIRERFRSRLVITLLPALLGLPYIVFAQHAGNLHPGLAAGMFLLPVALAALLQTSRTPAMTWQDAVALATL